MRVSMLFSLVVSVLSVGGADGEVNGGAAIAPARLLERLVARAERRGWKPADPSSPTSSGSDIPLTPSEVERGFIFFQRSANERVYPHSAPRPGERSGVVRFFGAAGETVSVQVALRTLRRLRGVNVNVGPLRGPRGVVGLPVVSGPGRDVPAAAIRCRWVEYAPVRRPTRRWRRRRGRRPGRFYRVVPLRIRSLPRAGLDLPENWTQAFWLNVRIPPDQPPGRYEGVIEVVVGGRLVLRLPCVLTVLPVRLEEPKSMFFGAFLMLAGEPTGPDVHTVARLRDLAERGIHGILWFWGHYGLAVRRMEDDRLRLDFTSMDIFMERVKRAGLKGPVVLALGNDSHAHLEEAIGLLWNLPLRYEPLSGGSPPDHRFVVGTLNCPRMDALYIEAIRQLLEHARARGWPELVLLPYDEPTERLKAEYLHRAGLLKKYFPRVRIYGVVMNDAWALDWLGRVSDILVANGNLGAVRAYAREHGKDFWTYGGRCQAAYSFGRARWDYGLRPWAEGSEGHWFWAYNWHVGDPLDEFDGSVSDAYWVVAYPPEARGGPCVPSPAFEGLRAGVDDVRYLEALQRLVARLPRDQAHRFRQRLDDLRTDIRRYRWAISADRPIPPQLPFPIGPVCGYDAFRLRIIGMILEVLSLLRADGAS